MEKDEKIIDVEVEDVLKDPEKENLKESEEIVKEKPQEKNETMLGVLAHILGYFFSFLGPLVIYLVADKNDEATKSHAREAINFNASILLWYVISGMFWLVLVGFLMTGLLFIFQTIAVIMAVVAAKDGKEYKYPLTIRFLK